MGAVKIRVYTVKPKLQVVRSHLAPEEVGGRSGHVHITDRARYTAAVSTRTPPCLSSASTHLLLESQWNDQTSGGLSYLRKETMG